MNPKPLIIASLLALLGACAGTQQAYKAAEGLEETAFVMNQHYLALVREANRLADQGVITGSSLRALQDLIRTSRPLLGELAGAAQAYENVRSAATEAELTAAISAAAVALSDLVNAIRAAGGTAKVPIELEPRPGILFPLPYLLVATEEAA